MLDNEILTKVLGKVEIATILKRMRGEKLKQTEKNYLSRSVRPKLIAAKILGEEKILEKIQRPDRSIDNKIIYNLSKYGYELINPKKIKKQRAIPIERLIAIIITKSPKPRWIGAIPTLLIKNKISKFKLVEIACRYNIYNELGYLVEIATILIKHFKIKQDLNDILDYLKNNKNKEVRYLGEVKDSIYMQFLIKTSPNRIKKWNLLGRFFDEEFIKNAEAYL